MICFGNVCTTGDAICALALGAVILMMLIVEVERMEAQRRSRKQGDGPKKG